MEGVSERLAINEMRLGNILHIVEENEIQLDILTRQVGELKRMLSDRNSARRSH